MKKPKKQKPKKQKPKLHMDACPECGGQVTGYEFSTPHAHVTGNQFPVPLPGGAIRTLRPCGHSAAGISAETITDAKGRQHIFYRWEKSETVAVTWTLAV